MINSEKSIKCHISRPIKPRVLILLCPLNLFPLIRLILLINLLNTLNWWVIDCAGADCISLTNAFFFQDKPFLVSNLNLGECLEKWTPEYLAKCLGKRKIVVHSSKEKKMSFIEKNFKYEHINFDDFIKQASSNTPEKSLYLRSVGDNSKSRDVADFWKNFPEISKDFKLPQFLHFNLESEIYFSSVLRIASPGFNLWTHYDIMDNMLFNIHGSKEIVLFPPEDLEKLYLIGDKSQIKDLQDSATISQYPKLAQTNRFKCRLIKGEALFIPSLWFHNVTSENFTISINTFWKDGKILTQYDPDDIYGNRHLIYANKALKDMKKGITNLNSLPSKFSKFYLQMLRHEISECLKSD